MVRKPTAVSIYFQRQTVVGKCSKHLEVLRLTQGHTDIWTGGAGVQPSNTMIGA